MQTIHGWVKKALGKEGDWVKKAIGDWRRVAFTPIT